MTKEEKDIQNLYKAVKLLKSCKKDNISICYDLKNIAVSDERLDGDQVVVIQQNGDCYIKELKCCYYEVTREEAVTLVNDSLLKPSALYKITDRGDQGIFLNAIASNKFQEEGVRLMLIPNIDIFTLANTWHPYYTYSINDLVMWYGYVYKNLTGNNGTDSPYTDTTNWNLISKDGFDNFEYAKKQFGVIYDWDNDWISKQWDEHGNIFGIDFRDNWDTNLNVEKYVGFNPVDVSDWVLGDMYYDETTVMFNNKCDGIFGNFIKITFDGEQIMISNNDIIGAIRDNGNYSSISNNTIRGYYGIIKNDSINSSIIHITHNSNTGDIIGNSANEISYNSNLGFISYNYCDNDNFGGFITHNSNNGNITYNGDVVNRTTEVYSINNNNNNGNIEYNSTSGSAGGYIEYNSNNGNISGNVIYGPISYNSNLGHILNNLYEFGEVNIGVQGILNNSNNGSISGNTNNGEIQNNSNAGSIDTNSNLGNILNNSNNGVIYSNTSSPSLCNIYSNINNGDITGAQVADVFDVIVNK